MVDNIFPMGMLDYYEPDTELKCPRCGQILSNWQGEDADNALFVWKQDVRHPLTQCVDEEYRLTIEDLKRFTLPKEFLIYTHCTCSTKFLFEAFGTATDGLWLQTLLLQPCDIDKVYSHLPRTKHNAMRK